MASKLSILLVITTVIRVGLTLNTFDSCPPTTTNGADLAAFQFGEDMAHDGYRRTAHVIFDELVGIVGKRSGDHCDYNAGLERARNQSVTAMLVGNVPFFDGMAALFRTDLDVPAVSKLTTLTIQKINANTFLGVQAVHPGCDYMETQAEISKLRTLVQGQISDVKKIIISATPKGSEKNRIDAQAWIAYITEKELNVQAGFEAIFEGIYTVLDALSNSTATNDDVEVYLAKLAAGRQKAVKYFNA